MEECLKVKGLGGNIDGCRDKTSDMVSKGFPSVTTSGRQYDIGEKPSVLLYAYTNLHAGTSKPQSFLSKGPGLQCSNMVLYDLREVKVKFN